MLSIFLFLADTGTTRALTVVARDFDQLVARADTVFKAPAAGQTLRFLGGTVGNDALEVPEMPRFEVGQKAVLFVVGNGKQFCPLVGVAPGRFHVVRDEATGRERVLTNDGYPVIDTAEQGGRPAALMR